MKILITIMVAILILTFSGFVEAEVLKVKKDGCDNSDGDPSYCDIKTALNNASDDDVIDILDNEIYDEGSLEITKKLTIQGDPNNRPTFKGIMELAVDGVTIKDLRIEADFTLLNIMIKKTNNHNILNNIFDGSTGPMSMMPILAAGFNNRIEGNEFHDFQLGMLIVGNNLDIKDNTFYNNDYGFVVGANNSDVRDNTVYNNTTGIYFGGEDTVIQGNEVYNNETGIHVLGGKDNIITKNNIHHNSDTDDEKESGGIKWISCENLDINHNDIHHNENGILGYWGISGNKANKNNIDDNTDYGVSYDPNETDTLEDTQLIFDAENNWWGQDTGPEAGDVSAYVDYVPSENSEVVIEAEPYITLPDICGDRNHMIPDGDLTEDCIVNLNDFAIMAGSWLECTDPLNCIP